MTVSDSISARSMDAVWVGLERARDWGRAGAGRAGAGRVARRRWGRTGCGARERAAQSLVARSVEVVWVGAG